jgi:hypothetical protein
LAAESPTAFTADDLLLGYIEVLGPITQFIGFVDIYMLVVWRSVEV